MNNVKIRRITSASAPFLSGTAAILLAVAIVLAPESSFAASLQGLKLWWTLIFPALLPFLILSEMVTASGLVHGFGVLLEPLMKRLFRLPGAGGWVIALGMTAGFPAGAGGANQLHRQGGISDKDAARLAAVAHFASPITLLIVVGVAFLHSPAAGYVLLAVHWLSGLAAGLTSALFARKNDRSGDPGQVHDIKVSKEPASLLRRVYDTVLAARARDGRSFGKLLGEAVATSVQSLMVVGGYIIIFSVVLNIAVTLCPGLPHALAASFLEIHLGANALTSMATAESTTGPLSVTGMALLSAALAWGGICGQLQSLTAVKQAKARFIPYASVRLLHAIYALVFTVLLWKPLMNVRAAVVPVTSIPDAAASPGTLSALTVWRMIPELLSLQTALLLILLALSALIYMITWLRRPAG